MVMQKHRGKAKDYSSVNYIHGTVGHLCASPLSWAIGLNQILSLIGLVYQMIDTVGHDADQQCMDGDKLVYCDEKSKNQNKQREICSGLQYLYQDVFVCANYR